MSIILLIKLIIIGLDSQKEIGHLEALILKYLPTKYNIQHMVQNENGTSAVSQKTIMVSKVLSLNASYFMTIQAGMSVVAFPLIMG